MLIETTVSHAAVIVSEYRQVYFLLRRYFVGFLCSQQSGVLLQHACITLVTHLPVARRHSQQPYFALLIAVGFMFKPIAKPFFVPLCYAFRSQHASGTSIPKGLVTATTSDSAPPPDIESPSKLAQAGTHPHIGPADVFHGVVQDSEQAAATHICNHTSGTSLCDASHGASLESRMVA